MVNQVKRGTPGYEAGFNVGDEILAIGDDRVPPDQWSKRMEFFRPGDKVSILISRRDRLRRLDATFGQEPPRQWTLEANPERRRGSEGPSQGLDRRVSGEKRSSETGLTVSHLTCVPDELSFAEQGQGT